MSKPSNSPPIDWLVVGGGLQGALIALALLDRRPECRLALIERDEVLGGNHTWCFHADDVPSAARGWIEPLVSARWSSYEVAFPGEARTIASPYACIASSRLDRVVRERLARAPGAVLVTGEAVAEVSAQGAVLCDGSDVRARQVIDARGASSEESAGCGYQVFLGLELELEAPHGMARPMLMDATVPQAEGYRFFYVLPLDERRVLVEDTRFTNSPRLDGDSLRAEIAAHVDSRGWRVARELREERGVLPMPWKGADPAPGVAPLRAGYRGNWFHPATGYSLPVAVRLAQTVAEAEPEHLPQRIRALARKIRPNVRYARRLNRLLFRWYEPHRRWRVFSRFYRLPEPVVRRFYSLRSTTADRLRILVGRPPGLPSIEFRLRAGRRSHVLSGR